MGSNDLQVDLKKIKEFCRENRILKLAFYGSVLSEDFNQDSDVDVLVEFEPGQEPGFMRLASMERTLSEMIGRHVDLRTPEDLSSGNLSFPPRNGILRISSVPSIPSSIIPTTR